MSHTLDMYQSYVLHGGPLDGYLIRARAGVLVIHAADPGDPRAEAVAELDPVMVPAGVPADTFLRYRRVTVWEDGPFPSNEYHWVDPEAEAQAG